MSDDKIQTRIVTYGFMHADALAKAQAKLDVERAELSAEMRALLRDLDGQIVAALTRGTVGNTEDFGNNKAEDTDG